MGSTSHRDTSLLGARASPTAMASSVGTSFPVADGVEDREVDEVFEDAASVGELPVGTGNLASLGDGSDPWQEEGADPWSVPQRSCGGNSASVPWQTEWRNWHTVSFPLSSDGGQAAPVQLQ